MFLPGKHKLACSVTGVWLNTETIKAASKTGAELHGVICAYSIQQVLAWQGPLVIMDISLKFDCINILTCTFEEVNIKDKRFFP